MPSGPAGLQTNAPGQRKYAGPGPLAGKPAMVPALNREEVPISGLDQSGLGASGDVSAST